LSCVDSAATTRRPLIATHLPEYFLNSLTVHRCCHRIATRTSGGTTNLAFLPSAIEWRKDCPHKCFAAGSDSGSQADWAEFQISSLMNLGPNTAMPPQPPFHLADIECRLRSLLGGDCEVVNGFQQIHIRRNRQYHRCLPALRTDHELGLDLSCGHRELMDPRVTWFVPIPFLAPA